MKFHKIHMGIRTKLLLPMLIAFFLLVLMVRFTWVNDYLEHEHNNWKYNQQQVLDVYAPYIQTSLLTGDFSSLHATLNQAQLNQPKIWKSFQVVDHIRQLTFSSRIQPDKIDTKIITLKKDIVWGNKHLATLKVMADIGPKLLTERQAITKLLTGALIIVGIITIVAVMWQNRLIRLPLVRLQHATERLARGDANVALSDLGNDEIGQLTQTFIDMRTKLQKALQQVQANELRYRDVFNNAIDGIVTIDGKGMIMSMNRTIEQLFGYSSDDVINKHFTTLLSEPYDQEYATCFNNYIEGDDSQLHGVRRDIKGRRKDGSSFNMNFTISVVKHGDHSLFCATLHDITERLDSEYKIRYINKLMTSMVDSLPLGIMVEDEYHRILHVNQLFCDLFDIKTDKESLVGTHSQNYLNEISHYFQDEDNFRKTTLRHITCKEVVISEELVLTDGRHLERDYIPISLDSDSKDDHYAHLWSYGDITSRKRIEASVRKQSLQLATAAKEEKSMSNQLRLALQPSDMKDYLHEALLEIINSMSHTSHQVEGAILLYELVDNLFEKTIITSQFTTPYLKNDCRRISFAKKTNVSDNLQDGDIESFETESKIAISVSSIEQHHRYHLSLNQNNTEIGAIILYFPHEASRTRDDENFLRRIAKVTSIGISRRNDNRALIHAKIEAESAAQSKSAFLATMSHEIRTPMNGVLGMAQILDNTELTETQRHYLNTITTSSKALLVVINDILDFSKIEAGKMKIDNLPFNLEQTIYEVCNLLAGMAREKGLELILDYAVDCPRLLIGDASRIRQLLMNLMGNAIKFTHVGYILVHIDCLKIQENTADIQVKIYDTGIGIAAKAQTNLFQSFTQADDSTTRRFGGTGLGLAIAKQLTELMGGTIGVDSAEGRGSSFWANLPLAISNDTGIKIHPVLSGKRVLVIDDLALNRRMFQQQLNARGMLTEVAESRNECMQYLYSSIENNQPFDIVLIDDNLNGEQGKSLAKIIHNTDEFSHIPLILLSDISQRTDTKILKKSGFENYILKPVNSEILTNTLSSVLRDEPHTLDNSTVNSGLTLPDNKNLSRFTGKALLVEDVTFNQQVAKIMLEQLGLTVTIAVNGQESIDLWSSEPFDIIFMDYQMPVMDGLEATRIIREQEKISGDHITIIALTANTTGDILDQCRYVGMDDILIKPFEIKDLVNILNDYITKDSEHSSDPSDTFSLPLMTNLYAGNFFDEKKFSQLVALLGDNIQPLVESFMSNARTRLLDLNKAITDNNSEQICNIAHTLSDISGNIGASSMHLIANELSRRSSELSSNQSTTYITQLEQHFEQVNQWLHTNMDFMHDLAHTLSQSDAEAHNEVVIDDLKYNSVRGTLGEEVFAQLIPTFISSVTELIKKIQQRYVNDDLQSIALHAHSLKSACANIGARQLQTMAALLEQTIQQGNISDVKNSIAQLITAFEAVESALQRKSA